MDTLDDQTVLAIGRAAFAKQEGVTLSDRIFTVNFYMAESGRVLAEVQGLELANEEGDDKLWEGAAHIVTQRQLFRGLMNLAERVLLAQI